MNNKVDHKQNIEINVCMCAFHYLLAKHCSSEYSKFFKGIRRGLVVTMPDSQACVRRLESPLVP